MYVGCIRPNNYWHNQHFSQAEIDSDVTASCFCMLAFFLVQRMVGYYPGLEYSFEKLTA